MAEVRRHFGSTVHFSSSASSKEFFLVVSFSSASFSLSEESVGVALQCCIGGDRNGFCVFQLSDHHFHFLVASSLVGHFVYRLRDRIWLDFICHFSLFRGVHPSLLGLTRSHDNGWCSSEQDGVIAQHSPTLMSSSLSFLKASVAADHSLASSSVPAKFGFHARSSVQATNSNMADSPTSSSSRLRFGYFSDPFCLAIVVLSSRRFVGINFVDKLCSSLSRETLEHLEDLRDAQYSDMDIMQVLGLRVIPPKDLVFSYLGRCYLCGLENHLADSCPGVCNAYQREGYKCSVYSSAALAVISCRHCSLCLGASHSAWRCLVGLRCRNCLNLGHWAFSCFRGSSHSEAMPVKRQVWVAKSKPSVSPISPRASSTYVQVTPLSPCASSTSIPLVSELSLITPMASFSINPSAFLPNGMVVDPGPADHKMHSDLVVLSSSSSPP